MAAKRRRTNKAAVNEDFQLPEAIIQLIQSYLDGKQAAQTTVLSKLWYNAWLTRPSLDFDQRNFQVIDEFVSFMKKTMERYEDLRLKIESFRLFMNKAGYDSVSLATEVICKAMKMGVSDFNFQFDLKTFVLPKGVLEADSLVRLSVNGCKIDPPVDRKILCLGLRYLRLESVYVEEDTIQDIISSCPLIEDFQLSSCLCLVKVQGFRTKKLACRVPLLEHEKQNVGPVVDNQRKVLEFCKLKCLLLEGMDLDSSFFHDFSLKFPLLEDLTIHCCDCPKGIQISSHTLKFINLKMPKTRMLRAKFDFPRIRKFTYSGAQIPSVSFRSFSSQWESDISIFYTGYYLRKTWFLDLKKFLLKLSPSRISLSLHCFTELQMKNYVDYVKGVELLPKPVVENLTLSMCLSSIEHPALLDGLFSSFHPKIIILKWSTILLSYRYYEILKKLIQQVCTCFCIQEQQTMLCFRDLEEANLEEAKSVLCPNDTLRKWLQIWKTWLDAPPSPVYREGDSLNVRLLTI